MLWARVKINAHTAIIAKTGAGKSKLMELLIYDQQRKSQDSCNKAICMIDVHGDFARSALSFIHNKQRPDRIVYVSSSISREYPLPNGEAGYTPTINPFMLGTDKSVEATSIYANEIADAISELLETATHPLTVQMSALLRPAIFTVMYEAQNPGLDTLARMFIDKDGVNADLLAMGMRSPIPIYRDFFQHDWHSPEYAITKRSIRTKLLYFLADPMLSYMLNGESTVNLEECLNEGKVVIINVPKSAGKFTSSVFSRLMVAFITAIMIRRDSIPDRKRRKPCFLYLDEFQTMITSSLVSSLAECRKYGLSVVLATQTLDSLDKQTKTNVLVNTGIKMVSLLNHEGQLAMSKELGVTIETLKKLEPLQFIVRRTGKAKYQAFKFTVPILSSRHYLTRQEHAELLKYIVEQSGQYKKVSVPPAPPSPLEQERPTVTTKTNTKKKNDTPFGDGIQPSF